jgi:NarL family two-component system response regulator YdfI
VTRVFIVSSSEVVRAGLAAIVESNRDLQVSGTASDAGTVEENETDVVLLDLESNEALTEYPLELPAVVLANGFEDSWVADALRSGVRAILPRRASGPEIIGAIFAAAAGLVVVHPNYVSHVISHADLPAAHPSHPVALAQPLSPREVEVLGLLAEGTGNKQIAWRLGISEHTVKYHISSLFNKLNASSRTEAVAIGVRLGLVLL